MSALVQVRGERVVASSLEVARSFDKRHDHVMRTIKDLLDKCSDLTPNFGELIASYDAGKGAQRKQRYYEIDRKGFTLLVMGFTGPKALEWKIAYIDAFDRMEAALRAASANDHDDDMMMMAPARPASDAALPFVERMKFEPPNIQLAYVREMRLVRGRPGAIMAMRELGWEEADTGRHESLAAASDPAVGQVLRWVRDRTESAPGYRARTMALHHDFIRWCADLGLEILTLTKFGRALNALGYPSRKSDAVYKLNIRLRE